MHIKHMHEMIEKLAECTKSAIEGNQTHIGQYPISEVVDMMKDLSEAEYYARISKAMEEAEEEDEAEEKYMLQRMKEEYGEDNGQRCYNDWRYANGRYAPKGRGRRTRGYTEPIIHDVMYPQEVYRDWDRWNGDGMGRMYYPDKDHHDLHMDNGQGYSDGYNDGNTRGYEDGYARGRSEGEQRGRSNQSRSERARRGYEDTQRTNSNSTQDGKEKRMKELNTYMDELSEDMKTLIKDMSAEERTMLKSKIAKLGTLV